MGNADGAGNTMHVFCVDHSRTFRHVLKAVFEHRHVRTTVQEYSPDVFDQISNAHPDVVVLDLAFGRDSGWTLLDQLSESVADRTPVIITSTDRKTLKSARHSQSWADGPRAYLAKPFDINVLTETAERLANESDYLPH